MPVAGHCYSGFRLDERVGTTPVAELWRATDLRGGSIRGIRILAEGAREHAAGFHAAAEIQRELAHANRVGLRDVVEVEGVPALVVEHVSGPSLATWMRIRHRSTEDVLTVFQDVVAGVAAGHAFGLLHLHLEPSSVWMHTRKGSFVPKVDLAFGPMGISGLSLGPIRAPEHAMGETPDVRADLFLLGTILYELLAGRPPYDASHARLHPMIAAASCRPLEDVRGDLPRSVTDLVEQLLAPSPRDRPSSAAEVMRLLLGATESSESSAPVSAPAAVAPPPRPPAEPTWMSEGATVDPRLGLASAGRGVTARRVRPAWNHPLAVASMVAAGLLSLAGALVVTLGG